MTINDWHVTFTGDAYTAPELRRTAICGRVDDGRHITTSAVVEAAGREVRTFSGSVYRLGRISREYRRWLADNGHEYDPRQPLRTGVGR